MSFVPTPISAQQPITINDEAVSSADNDGTLKTPRKTYGMKRMAEEDLGKDSSKKRPKIDTQVNPPSAGTDIIPSLYAHLSPTSIREHIVLDKIIHESYNRLIMRPLENPLIWDDSKPGQCSTSPGDVTKQAALGYRSALQELADEPEYGLMAAFSSEYGSTGPGVGNLPSPGIVYNERLLRRLSWSCPEHAACEKAAAKRASNKEAKTAANERACVKNEDNDEENERDENDWS